MIKKFKYTIIIPVISFNKYLKINLEYLNFQKYKNFQVIIVTDKKFNLNKFKYKFGTKIILSKIKTPGAKRNLGTKYSHSDYFCFLDDDSYAHHNWLSRANEIIKSKKRDNYIIGGPGVLPHDDNFLSKIIDLFFTSIFLGPIRARYLSLMHYKNKKFDDWPSVNLIISKKNFIKIGGYDEDYWPGEDSKLCLKFINQIGKIVYAPDLIVYHYRRVTLCKFTKQILRYSRTRGLFFRRAEKNSLSIYYFLPSILLLYVVYILYNFNFGFFEILFLVISTFFLILDFIISYQREKNFLRLILSRILIVYSILIYGFGFFLGILSMKNQTKLGR
jgi:glycosyltransferase involved in cell wall biosynthesis